MSKLCSAVVRATENFIFSDQTRLSYRCSESDFTRNRKLRFEFVVLGMLRLLRHNLGAEIETFLDTFGTKLKRFTPSAFIQARQKIKPDLFFGVNAVVVKTFYEEVGAEKLTFRNLRLLAIDGSTLNVPYSPELAQKYASHSNQLGRSELIAGRCSVLYDLLNEIALDGHFASLSAGEHTLAYQHMEKCGIGDLVILDRSYPSFGIAWALQNRGAHFLFRCKDSFSLQTKAFYESGKKEEVVEMTPAKGQSFAQLPYNKNSQIRVRLLRIPLPNNKVEILMTSLIDQQVFPHSDFKWLYRQRWKVETFYDRFKNVIAVERFSGKSEQFIQQEFYCALYMANMQTILTHDAQEEVNEKHQNRRYTYKIASSLSFGFIRQRLLQIFANNENQQTIFEELKKLFVRHVSAVRPNRSFPRNLDKYRSRRLPKQFPNRKPTG